MTTKDSDQGRLQAHNEPQMLEAHEEAKQLGPYVDDTAAPLAADPIFTNSTKGNISKAMKWGMAIMLALAVASAVVVCIGLAHHKASAPADMTAYTTPGGNFLLNGRGASQFAFLNTSDRNAAAPAVSSDEMTATAITPDGKSQIIAIADPSTKVVYLFELDGSQIPDNATLNEFVKRIAGSDKDVTIVAYTDPSGSVAHNQRLSERRAKALGDYLTRRGVKASQVKTKGYGATDAFGSPRLDRRAELHVK